MLRLNYFVVDSFARMPFTGNPAAVCLVEQDLADEDMQQIAAEFNLSETAFVSRNAGSYSIRWFTPTTEVDLCGHATLAATKGLLISGKIEKADVVTLSSKSGPLRVWTNGDDTISLDFPVLPYRPAPPPAGLLEALGLPSSSVAEFYESLNGTKVLAVVGDGGIRSAEQMVRQVRPDFARLLQTEPRSVILTGRADGADHDFVSRFFAPSLGIAEDPVTGAAHCFLAPYWCGQLKRERLVGYQASARGGYVSVCLNGSRVELTGSAIVVMSGVLEVMAGR